MLRSKLLLFVTSGALLFTSCSDSGTNPGDGEKETEQSETLVKNPSDGAKLEGKITFSVDESGEFNELRIYVDDELIETINNPSLPYDYALTTFNFSNGDHDIIAELDPSDGSTTIEGSVSVTFENYMLEVDTDGYIEYDLKSYDKYYLFISDPEGNVLQSVDLKNQTGIVKILPPEELEKGAPEYFFLTQLYYRINHEAFLNTYGSLEPWTTQLNGDSYYSNSDPSPKKELTLELGNFDKSYQHVSIAADKGYTPSLYINQNDTLQSTFEYDANADHLFFIMLPISDPVPKYRWKKDVEKISDPDTLRYDVSNDFTEMITKKIPCPYNFSLESYSYQFSVSPDTWDDGEIGLLSLGSQYDGCSDEFSMFFPDINHLYSVKMTASNFSELNAEYFQSTKKFPKEFKPLESEFNISNNSLNNMHFEATGSMDLLHLYFWNQEGGLKWNVFLPDTTKSFVLPKIADSLDTSTSFKNRYNRNGFSLSRVYLKSSSDYKDYQEYFNMLYGTGKSANEVYRYKRINYGTNKAKGDTKESEVSFR